MQSTIVWNIIFHFPTQTHRNNPIFPAFDTRFVFQNTWNIKRAFILLFIQKYKGVKINYLLVGVKMKRMVETKHPRVKLQLRRKTYGQEVQFICIWKYALMNEGGRSINHVRIGSHGLSIVLCYMRLRYMYFNELVEIWILMLVLYFLEYNINLIHPKTGHYHNINSMVL